MPTSDKPAAEVDVDEALVRMLLEAQHPDLAGRILELVASGWDNAVYRLGEDLAVRLPRREVAAELARHELRWLPELAPRLPLPIPVPVRAGEPHGEYPWPWSICRWVPGEVALAGGPLDAGAAAADLGRFLAALHRPAPADAPVNPFRGVPLAARHERLLAGLEVLEGEVDVRSLRRAWDRAMDLPAWDRAPRWLHGDMHPANILVTGGRVAGVIDFGDITAGDPATDLAVAWMLLPAPVRPAFRSATGAGGVEDDDAVDDDVAVDDATWGRARAWALALGVVYLANSADVPAFAAVGRRTLEEVLADAGSLAGN